MRHLTVGLPLVGLLLMMPVTPVMAASPTPASTFCTITDPRIAGLSGLVVTDTGFISISDSNLDKSAIRIWFFDKACRVTRSIEYPTPAYDPEDMALGRDGTIYVADIGDNRQERTSIAIWRVAPGSSTPHIYRYRYPDHPHDAEALLLGADDTPIVVTKDIGAGEIFVPTAPADPSGKPVLLKRVGTFYPTVTATPTFLGIVGTTLVTGGANSADRTMVALRTYGDAYVWHVTNGDVVKTITTTKPRMIPLPHEPQGESIAFDPSGEHLYTVSDQEAEPVKTKIFQYALPTPVPSVPASPAVTPTPTQTSIPTTTPAPAAVSSSPRTPPVAGIAIVAGLLLLGGIAVVMLRKHYRRRTSR